LDRCALFVDAGYVLAEGALAVHGTRNRDSVSWDYAGLLKLLGGLSRDRTGLPLLRCYWYDTVAEGGRAAEHDTLADVPGVKLRLSKVRPSRKEGVEAEIRKDLSALARNRGVSDAVLVSAEEDLGPVIAEIQDLGIRVVLLHINTDGNWAIARSLRQECDDIIDMSAAHLRPFVDLIPGAEPAGRDSQLTSSGYRELMSGTPASAHLQGAGQQAIAAPAAQLYSSPVTPDYERVSQASPAASAREQQTGLAAQDAGRFSAGTGSGGQPEVMSGQGSQHRPDDAAPVPPHYQGQDTARGLPPGVGGQPGYGQNGFAADAAPPAGNGQGRLAGATSGQPGTGQGGSASGPQQHGGSGPHGLPPGVHPGGAVHSGSSQQSGLPQNGLPPLAPAQGAMSQNGGPQNGLAANGQLPGGGLGTSPVQQNGLSHSPYGQVGSHQPNGQLAGPGAAGPPAGGMQPGSGLPPGQSAQQPPSNGMHGHQQPPGLQSGSGMPPGSALPQPRNGMPGSVSHPGQGPGLPTLSGQPVSGQGQGQHGLTGSVTQLGRSMPPGHDLSPGQSLSPGQHGLPGQGLPGQGLPSQGLPSQGLPSQGLPSQGLPGHGQQPMPPGLSSSAPDHRQGQGLGPALGGAGNAPGGLVPHDHQRGLPPQRQIPAANGLPYPPPERTSQFSEQPAPYGAPGTGYMPAPYSGPQQSLPVAPPPVAISVGEAVQSAHAEGFGFGEAVARDAPALWLEAVLARKPRMPSDLEARLLQGSALPIDSLLHDEVRHALRRGFWDALERSRH
jgi:NYN domain/GLTT repeat (6 copies)